MSLFFFFNATATTEIYTYGHTLSLHDALPISVEVDAEQPAARVEHRRARIAAGRVEVGQQVDGLRLQCRIAGAAEIALGDRRAQRRRRVERRGEIGRAHV